MSGSNGHPEYEWDDAPAAGTITGPHMLIAVTPPPRSVLFIGDVIRIESRQRVPNAWVRFWYRALLGWRWEKVGGQ